MSTISSTGITPSSTPVAPVETATTAEAAPRATVIPPIYQSSFTAQSTAMALGLSAPRNVGDVEALFASISAQLSDSETVNKGYEDAARTSSSDTGLIALAQYFSELTSTATDLSVRKETLKQRETAVTEKSDALDTAQTELNTLQTSKTASEGRISDYSTQTATLTSERDGLLQQLANAPDDASEPGALTDAEKQTINDRLATISSEMSTLDTLVTVTNAAISTLDTQIDALSDQIQTKTEARDAAVSERDTAQSDFDTAEERFVTYIGESIGFSSSLSSQKAHDRNEKSTEKLADTAEINMIEALLQEAVDSIVIREADMIEAEFSTSIVDLSLPVGSGNVDQLSGRLSSFLGVIGSAIAALGQLGALTAPPTTEQLDGAGRVKLGV